MKLTITLNFCQECRYFSTRRNKTLHPTRTINEGYCDHDAFEYAGQGAMGVDGAEDIPIPPWCPLRENPEPKPPDGD